MIDKLSEKQLDKFKSVYQMIKELQPLYLQEDTDKTIMETTFGAAIFYLPKPKKMQNLWSGFRSQKSIETGEMVEEHYNTRKGSARICFEHIHEMSFEDFVEKFFMEFGRFNITTKNENRSLVNILKNNPDISWEKAYEIAGIILVNERI